MSCGINLQQNSADKGVIMMPQRITWKTERRLSGPRAKDIVMTRVIIMLLQENEQIIQSVPYHFT